MSSFALAKKKEKIMIAILSAVVLVSCTKISAKMLGPDSELSQYLRAEGALDCGSLGGDMKKQCEAENVAMDNAVMDRQEAGQLKSSERQVRIDGWRKADKRIAILMQQFMAGVLNGLKQEPDEAVGRMGTILRIVSASNTTTDSFKISIRVPNQSNSTVLPEISIKTESDAVATSGPNTRLDMLVAENDAQIANVMRVYSDRMVAEGMPQQNHVEPGWRQNLVTDWDSLRTASTASEAECPILRGPTVPGGAANGWLTRRLAKALGLLIDNFITQWDTSQSVFAHQTLLRDLSLGPVPPNFDSKHGLGRLIDAILNLIDFMKAWRAVAANQILCSCTIISEHYGFGFANGSKSFCCGTLPYTMSMQKGVKNPFLLQELYVDLAVVLLPVNYKTDADAQVAYSNELKQMVRDIKSDAAAIKRELDESRTEPIITDVSAMLYNIDHKRAAGEPVYVNQGTVSSVSGIRAEGGFSEHIGFEATVAQSLARSSQQEYLEEAANAADTISMLEDSLEHLARQETTISNVIKNIDIENRTYFSAIFSSFEVFPNASSIGFFDKTPCRSFLNLFLAPIYAFEAISDLFTNSNGTGNEKNSESCSFILIGFTTLLLMIVVSQSELTKEIASKIIAKKRGRNETYTSAEKMYLIQHVSKTGTVSSLGSATSSDSFGNSDGKSGI